MYRSSAKCRACKIISNIRLLLSRGIVLQACCVGAVEMMHTQVQTGLRTIYRR